MASIMKLWKNDLALGITSSLNLLFLTIKIIYESSEETDLKKKEKIEIRQTILWIHTFLIFIFVGLSGFFEKKEIFVEGKNDILKYQINNIVIAVISFGCFIYSFVERGEAEKEERDSPGLNLVHWLFIFVLPFIFLLNKNRYPKLWSTMSGKMSNMSGNMPNMSGGFGESFENKKTAIFLFVSALIIITLMMTMCETSPVDVEGIPVSLDTDGLRKSMPKWITEKNLSWTVFLAGSVLCVLGYVVSNQTRNNELGIGFLALSLIGMFVLTTIFDKILGLIKPKQEKFKNVKEKFLDLAEEKRKGDNHQTENFYTKIPETLAISIVPANGVIRNEVRDTKDSKTKAAITVSQNSLAIRIPTEVKKGYANHNLWYTGAVIDKTLNGKIIVDWITNKGTGDDTNVIQNTMTNPFESDIDSLNQEIANIGKNLPFTEEEGEPHNRSIGTQIASSSTLFWTETNNENPRRFLLLSKEKDPIQALLKGNGKGYVENPKSTDTRVSTPVNNGNLKNVANGKLTIYTGILSDGLYYLHSYRGNPKVLPNDDGFKIKTSTTAESEYTNDGSGNYTAAGGEQFKPVQPFKLMITSSNQINTSLINNVTGVTMIVMILYAIVNIFVNVGNIKENINLGNGVSIILFLAQFFALFQINAKSLGFGKEEGEETVWGNIEDSKTDMKKRNTIFTIATVAYVLRILQVSGLLFSIQQEYQS